MKSLSQIHKSIPRKKKNKMDQNHFLIFTPTTSHVHPLTSFSCIFLTFFFLTRSTALAKVNSQFLACVPKTCGDGQNITYPFYIRDQQPSYCGYPGFEVSCNSKGNPVLNIPDNDKYIIHHIFYKNLSLRVSNAGVWELNSSSSCDVVSSWQNLSLPLDRFELLGNKRDVFVLYNCRTQSLSERLVSKKVECNSTGDDVNGVVLALGEDDPDLGLARKECGDVVVAPEEGYGEDSMAMMTRLRSGFLMKWTASNCSICEESGGRCGFDNSMYHFKCFCPEGPHAWRCRVPGGNHATKVAIAAAALGIGILIIILVFYFRKKILSKNSMAFWRKTTENYNHIEAFFKNNGSLAPKRYKYSEIKRMTNSFKLKLGQGGYGGVYKGRLLDGRDVAVKVLNESKGNGEDFINEMASISRTSHVNVVSLLGYCFQGRKRALIYEFVSNGSLEKFIYQNNPNYKQLKWEKLYQIAIGIARGLEYLHRGCNTRILHFDIKPHNILLDEDFCPKISDFSLAKICPRKESIISMTGARGTIGYIAPEIFCRQFGEVSHKSDVYSFGMMVLEMAGRRKNLDVGVDRTSEIYFPHWIYERLEVDEELGLRGVENEEDKEWARKMIIVSLWCIQTNPSSRPAINRVVEMLEGSLDNLQIPPKPFLSSPRSQAPDSPASASLVC